MANKVQKPCRICGKMFTPCADCENDKTMFRWKRVACSPECAKEYFSRIEESRNQKIISETNNNDISLSNEQDEEMFKPKRGRKKNIEIEEREQID